MLRHDDAEKRFLDRIGLALKGTKAIREDIEVLRREGDETAIGQLSRKALVILGAIAFLEEDILRPAFESVLANNHGTLLALLQILRQQQNAIGDDIGEDFENNLMADPFLLVVGLARARRGRGQRYVKLP